MACLEMALVCFESHSSKGRHSKGFRKFQCRAWNVIGEDTQTFELKIGKLPEHPILQKHSYDKLNKILILAINETEMEPRIDNYRIDKPPKQRNSKQRSGDPMGYKNPDNNGTIYFR